MYFDRIFYKKSSKYRREIEFWGCYTFFLQEKKPKAQLNFHDNKFLRRKLYVRRTRGSPDFLFLFSKKRKYNNLKNYSFFNLSSISFNL